MTEPRLTEGQVKTIKDGLSAYPPQDVLTSLGKHGKPFFVKDALDLIADLELKRAEVERLKNMLILLLSYPKLRKHIGAQLYDQAKAALEELPRQPTAP